MASQASLQRAPGQITPRLPPRRGHRTAARLMIPPRASAPPFRQRRLFASTPPRRGMISRGALSGGIFSARMPTRLPLVADSVPKPPVGTVAESIYLGHPPYSLSFGLPPSRSSLMPSRAARAGRSRMEGCPSSRHRANCGNGFLPISPRFKPSGLTLVSRTSCARVSPAAPRSWRMVAGAIRQAHRSRDSARWSGRGGGR
mgnify:CR=1 FL=1